MVRTRRRRTLAITLGAILAVGVAGAVGVPFLFDLQNEFWKRLEAKLRSGQDVVFVSELTDSEWDVVCVLPPYALSVGPDREKRHRQYIEGDLGAFRDRLPRQDQDGWWAFAFVRDAKVVAIEEKGRSYYLRDRYEDNCMPRDQARFIRDGDYLFISDDNRGETP